MSGDECEVVTTGDGMSGDECEVVSTRGGMGVDECEVVTTRGGARAMLDRRVGEVMHPVVGPAIEATRLYIGPSRLAARLAAGGDDPLVLLDVGLGAGSNAIAAWRVSESLPASMRPLTIVSFERCLDPLRLALAPEHVDSFGLAGAAGEAARALLARGEHATVRTRWRLVTGELPDTLAGEPADAADLVFWDPYSARHNPTLWSLAAFTGLRRCCRPGVTLHTYSGATATRAALLLAGFFVGVGDASGDQRAGTCAALRGCDLARPLDLRWLARLSRSSAALPADAPADALRRISRHPQFAEDI